MLSARKSCQILAFLRKPLAVHTQLALYQPTVGQSIQRSRRSLPWIVLIGTSVGVGAIDMGGLTGVVAGQSEAGPLEDRQWRLGCATVQCKPL